MNGEGAMKKKGNEKRKREKKVSSNLQMETNG